MAPSPAPDGEPPPAPAAGHPAMAPVAAAELLAAERTRRRGRRRVRGAARRYSARISDVLYVLIGGLSTASMVIEEAPYRPLNAVAVGLLGGIATLALLWRRQRPVAVALVGMLSLLPAPEVGVFPLALGALAIRRRDRVLWAVAGGGWLLSLVTFRQPTEGMEPFEAATTTAITFALVMAVGAFVGARRDLVASLRARAEQAEAALALRSDQARLSERTRIAQEMHDVLAHRISLVSLHAGGLEVRPDAGPAEVERAATLIGSTARQALEDLRTVLGVLTTDISAEGLQLAPQPRLEDLPRLVASSTAAGVRVTLVDEVSGGNVPEVTGRTVYRVVQEALTNVHKHARDAATTVTVVGAPGKGLEVSVENVRPVSGSTLLPGSGMGLVGLRERVELAGGRLEAGPTPRGGWRVLAAFPWAAR